MNRSVTIRCWESGRPPGKPIDVTLAPMGVGQPPQR
jgi:hypothetical protein